jgi:signal transduction histidine kinase
MARLPRGHSSDGAVALDAVRARVFLDLCAPAGAVFAEELAALIRRAVGEPAAAARSLLTAHRRIARTPACEQRDHALLICANTLAQCALRTDRPGDAHRWSRRAVALLGPATPPGLCGHAHNLRGVAYLDQSAYASALEHFSRALAFARTAGDVRTEAGVVANVAAVLSQLACPRAAIALIEPVLRSLQAMALHERPDACSILLCNLAGAYLQLATEGAERRHVVLARRHARRAVLDAFERERLSDEAVATLNLAQAETLAGHPWRGLRWLWRLLPRASTGSAGQAVKIGMAGVALEQGRIAQAAAWFDALLPWTAEANSGIELSFLKLQVDLRRAQGRWHDAADALAALQQWRCVRDASALRERAMVLADGCLRDDRQLMAFLAHDLRAPLHSLARLSDQPRGDDEVRELAARAARDIGRTVDRFDSGVAASLSCPAMPFSLAAAMRAAQSSVAADAQACAVTVDMTPADDTAVVCGRIDVVERALVNLLVNAIGVSAPGDTVCLSLDGGGPGQWCVRVADTGPGWGAAAAGASLPASRAHFGLGLDFVRRAAAAHGGSVKVQTGPDGRGVVVALVLAAATPS